MGGSNTSPRRKWGTWREWLAFGSQWIGIVHALPPTESPALPAVPQPESGDVAAAAPSRSNLTPAVVYVTADRHIHEIAPKGSWQHRDLTAASGAPVAYAYCSRPVAYRRSDGVSMVVYRGLDSHVHSIYLELQRQGNTWQEVWKWADLTYLAGVPAADELPWPYNRCVVARVYLPLALR